MVDDASTESVLGPRHLVLWFPIIGAPLGLAIAIILSLTIAGWHVTHSVVVQTEQVWQPGESLALRAALLDAEEQPTPDVEVAVDLQRASQTHPLGTFHAKDEGQALANLQVPDWESGPAKLHLQFSQHGQAIASEVVELEVRRQRESRTGALTVSSSTLNWGDNTEPQPDKIRINVRPIGRLLAGFDNTLMVRVTRPDGTPVKAPVRVSLVEGEFMGKRGADPAPLLVQKSTSALGLMELAGPYASDVLSLQIDVLAQPKVPDGAEEVEEYADDPQSKKPSVKPSRGDKPTSDAAGSKVDAPNANADTEKENVSASYSAEERAEDDPAIVGTRKFRMVSFAGAVRLQATEPVVAIPHPVEIAGRALRARRSIYVDIHGSDGAWVHSFDPPILGREPPREWSTAGLAPGLYQVEAYHYVNAPGESTAVARVWLVEGAANGPESLVPLIAKQREVLELPRVEKAFEQQLETDYLDNIEKLRASLTPEEIVAAQTWLIGTLPVEVLGPPVAHTTRVREEQALADRKARWVDGVRWFLLGGGGSFLFLTCVLIFWSHSRSARELAEASGDDIKAEVRAAQRAVLVRGMALVVTMALGLVLTMAVLDKLLWSA